MNRFVQSLVFVSITSMAFIAQAQTQPSLRPLLGKKGQLSYSIDGELQFKTDCKVKVTNDDIYKMEYLALAKHDTGYWSYTFGAILNDSSVISTANDVTVIKTTEHGRRPGGSKCGDITPMFGYKKLVEVGKNSITLREKYICGLSRVEEVAVCQLK